MKQKLILIVIFLAIMALLPFTAVKCSFNSNPLTTVTDTADTVIKDDKENILRGLVSALYDDSYCTETIRAITIMLSTNYDVSTFDLNDENIYLPENKLSGSKKEFYGEIKKIVNSNKEFYLSKNNEKLYIPYSDSSNGKTVQNDYLSSVASPWDCFNQDYGKNVACYGVSLSGIDYLCKNGMNAEQALLWYLPDFEINN